MRLINETQVLIYWQRMDCCWLAIDHMEIEFLQENKTVILLNVVLLVWAYSYTTRALIKA